MPLVAAKCTQCGAELQVDNSKDAAVCKYCGTPFIVEKAINNYNTYVTQNFQGANVIIQGKTVESILTRAMQFMKIDDWEKANEYVEDALDIEPENSKAWMYKLFMDQKICSLEDAIRLSKDLSKSSVYYVVSTHICPEDLRNLKNCIKRVKAMQIEEINEKKLNDLKREAELIPNKIDSIKNIIEMKERYLKEANKGFNISAGVGAIAMVLAFIVYKVLYITGASPLIFIILLFGAIALISFISVIKKSTEVEDCKSSIKKSKEEIKKLENRLYEITQKQ